MASNRLVFQAVLYDGKSAAAHPVHATVGQDQSLEIAFDTRESRLSFAPGQFRWEPPVGDGSILLKLPQGMQLEVPFSAALIGELHERFPRHDAFVRKLESKRSLALSVAVAALGVIVALYLYAIPALAAVAQPLIPLSWKKTAGSQLLVVLDRIMLKPSNRGQGGQDLAVRLVRELQPFSGLETEPHVLLRRLVEEKKTEIKDVANAFALLPDTIVVTDGLLELLGEREAEAVIAHEMGHLAHDDGTRMLLRTSVGSAMALFVFGADPGVLQALALGVVNARYSQEQEQAADLYAARLLRRAGKNPLVLADALTALTEGAKESVIDKYLSSHPATSERIRSLEAFRE